HNGVLVGLNHGKRGKSDVRSWSVIGWSGLALSRLVWRGSLARRGRDRGWGSASSAASATGPAGGERGRHDRKRCYPQCACHGCKLTRQTQEKDRRTVGHRDYCSLCDKLSPTAASPSGQ